MLVRHSTYQHVREKYPWAAVIVKVRGGYRIFEYAFDYETWAHGQ